MSYSAPMTVEGVDQQQMMSVDQQPDVMEIQPIQQTPMLSLSNPDPQEDCQTQYAACIASCEGCEGAAKTECENYCNCVRNTCNGNPPANGCGTKPPCAVSGVEPGGR